MATTTKQADLLPQKKSQLKIGDVVRLADWIRRQKLEDVTADQLAQAAQRDLGIRITDNNIRGALKATGLALTTSLPAEQAAAAKIAIVADHLASLLDELGHPIPANLAAIASLEG